MRTLLFWFSIVCALLCGQVDPVWGYAAVAVLSVVQLAMPGGSGGGAARVVHHATLEAQDAGQPDLQRHRGPRSEVESVLLLRTGRAGLKRHRAQASRLGCHSMTTSS